MANPYEPASIRQQLSQPVKTLTRLADFLIGLARPGPAPQRPDSVKIVCISDSHSKIPTAPIPDGDILIHAGDLSNRAGAPAELQAQIDWLASLPHAHKVAIAGNHDTFLDPRSRRTLAASEQAGSLDWKDVAYLQDSSVTVSLASGRAIKIHGSPHVPRCGGDDFAFQYERASGGDMWHGRVPADTDVLVTHTPPRFHFDLPDNVGMGDVALLREVRRVQPALHVFGHIHGGRSDTLSWLRGGKEVVRWESGGVEEWFERALTRIESTAWLSQVLDPVGWWCLAMMVCSGVWAVVTDRLWARKTPTTLMVNASLTYINTGRLLNAPQVVYI